jgi:chromosome segregation protein
VLLEASRKADAKTNEYQLTKNMLEQMDGYPESIKFLKQNHEKSKRSPLLSDIISCTDAYKIAIENYLEPWLNYFIAIYHNDAVEGLQILADSSKGRANFFVLEPLKMHISKTVAPPPNSINALDVVEFDKIYEPLMRYLLGHVYLVTDNKLVADYTIDTESNMVLLSASGTLLKHPYSLAGGSVGLFDGKRTGKFKNLQILEDTIKALTANVEAIQTEILDTEKLWAINNADLREANQKLSATEIELSKCLAAITSLNNNKAFLQNGIDASAKTIHTLETQIAVLTNEHAQAAGNNAVTENLRTTLNQYMDSQKQIQELVNQLQIQSSEASQNFNQHNIQCIQQQNRIQTAKRDIEYKTTQQQNIETNQKNNAVELKNAIEQLSLNQNELIKIEGRTGCANW